MFAGSSNTQAFCQSETFRPRCLPAEAVIITKAVYGRMLHDSRCLQDEEELPALRDDPKYMGCFEDVLPLVSARCSGQSDCEIRIPDPEMEQSNPCYKNMFKYLVVTYRCITGIKYQQPASKTINQTPHLKTSSRSSLTKQLFYARICRSKQFSKLICWWDSSRYDKIRLEKLGLSLNSIRIRCIVCRYVICLI